MALFKYIYIVLFALALTFSAAFAQDSGFTTPAGQALIYDFDTGEVLFEKNARDPMPPASMTKIMTASLIFDALKAGHLKMDDEYLVSEEAVRRGGFASGSSNMALAKGSSVSIENLLRGVIVQSGNDACITLAEGFSGSETAFAELMTQKAREMGLDSATFKNATGWPDPGHEISAYDLAKLTRHSMKEHPELYKIYAEKSFHWNGYTQRNRNPLLFNFTGADGVKTGHTEVSGYGLVGSALRGDKRRIIVINGLESNPQRQRESIRVMEAAFRQFKPYKLYSSGDVIGDVDIYMGRVDTIGAKVDQDVLAGLFIGDRQNLSAKMTYVPAIAPVTEGDHIADLTVSAPGMKNKIIPLYATGSVRQKSLFGRLMTGFGSGSKG